MSNLLGLFFTVSILKIKFCRIENRPEDWDRLEKIYDDGGKYRMAYLISKANGDHEHDETTGN